MLPTVEATAQKEIALATLGLATRSMMWGAKDIPTIAAIGMRL
jgi:hypothetical protein